jgi:hypothetical protein
MADVELHHLGAGTVAGVGHIGAHGDPAADGYFANSLRKGCRIQNLRNQIVHPIFDG